MLVSIANNKQEFNAFVSSQKLSQFLQSYGWGEFQERLGNRVLPLAVSDNGNIVASALLIKKKMPFLNKYYWYCPRGPVMNSTYDSTYYRTYYSALFEEIKKRAGKDKVVFGRWDPLYPVDGSKGKLVKTIDIQPPKTVIIDLSCPQDHLLAQMHQKTRYNIRLSSRKGVAVRKAKIEEFNGFWELMEATSERDGFRLHGRDHYKKMLEANPDMFQLFLAEHQGRIIAGNIVSFFGDTATYVHGASDHEYRKLMAPYALQWGVMTLARDRGYKYYDLYGIDENKWPGVTRFKQGFGGKEIEYPGTYDMVFDKKWYWIYRWARKIRRRG
jgi:lipid II:glycine glycyltransferase (peptidoglycan interpeptide bridge formation enzyme)